MTSVRVWRKQVLVQVLPCAPYSIYSIHSIPPYLYNIAPTSTLPGGNPCGSPDPASNLDGAHVQRGQLKNATSKTAPLRKILQVLPSRIDAFVLPDLVPPRPGRASLAAGGGASGRCTDMYGIRSANTQNLGNHSCRAMRMPRCWRERG